MRGVVFPGNRKIEYLEVPDPTPGPLDVVIEMKASGMCGTDLQNYRNHRETILASIQLTSPTQ